MFNKTSQAEISPESPSGVQTEHAETQDTETVNGAAEPESTSAGVPPAGEDWQAKAQQLQDQFTRLAADFDNYRKRSREEQESMVKYGAQKSALELLPVLDNLERATASLTENSDPQVLYKSFSMIQKQLLDGLDAMGVRKIKAIGEPFDPQFHEAVNRMPSAEFPENSNMYEAQSGYQLHDKVIRPAMVVVSTGNPDAEPADLPSAESLQAEAENRANPFSQA